MSLAFPDSLDSNAQFIPAIANPSKIPSVPFSVPDVSTSVSAASAVYLAANGITGFVSTGAKYDSLAVIAAVERVNIGKGFPVLTDKQRVIVSGEGIEHRHWDSTAMNFWTAKVSPGVTVALASDTATITTGSGFPTGGNPGDHRVDFAANIVYKNTSGTWAYLRTASAPTLSTVTLTGPTTLYADLHGSLAGVALLFNGASATLTFATDAAATAAGHLAWAPGNGATCATLDGSAGVPTFSTPDTKTIVGGPTKPIEANCKASNSWDVATTAPVSGTTTLAASTDVASINFPAVNAPTATALAGKADKTASLAQFGATTSAQLIGVISDETGSGALVFGTAPTISSPTMTGTPVAPTPSPGANNGQVATMAALTAAVAAAPVSVSAIDCGSPDGTGGSAQFSNTIAAPTLTQVPSTSAALTLPFSANAFNTAYAVTMSSNCAITLGAPSANQTQFMTVDFIQGTTGGWVPTLPSTIMWAGGIAPTFSLSPGRVDTIQFRAVGNLFVQGLPVSMNQILPGIPALPASITVTPGYLSNIINVAPVSAVPAVTGYTIYRGPTAGTESATPIATNVALPYTDAGLTAGSMWYYQVAAVNTAGTGLKSAEGGGVPVTAVHYLSVPNGGDTAVYRAMPTAFQPGTQQIEVRALVMLNSVTQSSGNRFIVANWPTGSTPTTTSASFVFYVQPNGTIDMPVMLSTGLINAAPTPNALPTSIMSTPLWLSAKYNPATAVYTFATSTDNATYTTFSTGVGTSAGAAGLGLAASIPGSNITIAGGAGAGSVMYGRVYRTQIYINSALVQDLNFATASSGATTVTDVQGLVYTVGGIGGIV